MTPDRQRRNQKSDRREFNASPALSFQLLKSTRDQGESVQALKALAAYVLYREKVLGPVELTLDLTHPRRIQALNRRFRGVDRSTDVIAFRYGRGHAWEGDIAINVPQARLQARSLHHPARREIRLLLIHGILHLLGYTDYAPRPRRKMFQRQNQLLRQWERHTSGVRLKRQTSGARPYSVESGESHAK